MVMRENKQDHTRTMVRIRLLTMKKVKAVNGFSTTDLLERPTMIRLRLTGFQNTLKIFRRGNLAYGFLPHWLCVA